MNLRYHGLGTESTSRHHHLQRCAHPQLLTTLTVRTHKLETHQGLQQQGPGLLTHTKPGINGRSCISEMPLDAQLYNR